MTQNPLKSVEVRVEKYRSLLRFSVVFTVATFCKYYLYSRVGKTKLYKTTLTKLSESAVEPGLHKSSRFNSLGLDTSETLIRERERESESIQAGHMLM